VCVCVCVCVCVKEHALVTDWVLPVLQGGLLNLCTDTSTDQAQTFPFTLVENVSSHVLSLSPWVTLLSLFPT